MSCESRARKLVFVAASTTVDLPVIADFRATTALPGAAILVGTAVFAAAISADTVATNQPHKKSFLQELGDVQKHVVKFLGGVAHVLSFQ